MKSHAATWMRMLLIIAVYLVIIVCTPLLLAQGDAEYASFPDIETTVRNATVPVTISVIFVMAVITLMKKWPTILYEHKKVQNWIWIFPILIFLASVSATNYENIQDIGAGFTLILLLTTVLVGTGEELMFRGLVLDKMRSMYSEHKAALLSSLLFGLAHSINLIGNTNPSQIFQVVSAAFFGYFMYLSYRLSGTIVVPILLHALWDFSLFTSSTGTYEGTYVFAIVPMLVSFGLSIVLLSRRHKIEPDTK